MSTAHALQRAYNLHVVTSRWDVNLHTKQLMNRKNKAVGNALEGAGAVALFEPKRRPRMPYRTGRP